MCINTRSPFDIIGHRVITSLRDLRDEVSMSNREIVIGYGAKASSNRFFKLVSLG